MDQTIQLKRRSITVHTFTGKVASASKNMETRVRGGGGGGYTHQGTGYSAPVSISSTTVVHDTLFLIDRESNERALQLQDFDIACREGNMVSAVWAIAEGFEEGPYFAIVNHSTGQQFIKKSAVKKIVGRGMRPKFKEKTGEILAYVTGFIGTLFIFPYFAIAALIFLFIREIVWEKKYSKLFLASIRYPEVQP